MGGHSNLPTESEKDGAPSLTLSRLQLLGVGRTFSTQRHGESLSRLWDYTTHREMKRSQRSDDWQVVQRGEPFAA